MACCHDCRQDFSLSSYFKSKLINKFTGSGYRFRKLCSLRKAKFGNDEKSHIDVHSHCIKSVGLRVAGG